MIVAISSVKNEADIIVKTCTHLLGEGVDSLIVSDGGSTDGTWEILESLPNTLYMSQDGRFDQGEEITHLANIAAGLGADWIVPFDADEFWIDPLGASVSQVLCQVPANVGRVFAATYGHLDWTRRLPQKPLSKVCFRPYDLMRVHWGNHGVDGIPGDDLHGILEVRELQYRDFDHFLAKVEKARQLFDSWEVPQEHGSHMRALTKLNPAELEGVYRGLAERGSVNDPIPYRGAA